MGNHSQDGMPKIGFYNSEERFTDVLELTEFAETILGSQNKVMDFALPSPFFIRGKRILKNNFYQEKDLIHLMVVSRVLYYLMEHCFHCQYLLNMTLYLLTI